MKETAASQDDLVGLIDRLSDRTRQELRETPAEVAGARVEIGNAVTHSLEAYQHYLRAREIRLRTCDFVAAAKEARRALELDPEMGAAHMELATNLLNLGDGEESKRHFQLSRDRTARLPDKERRIVEVDTFMTHSVPVPGDRESQRQMVMRGVDELVTRYPQDEYVAYFAGQAHMYFRQWEQALEHYRRSLELDPGQCYVVGMVGPVLTRLGREAEILPLARRAVEARPNAASLAILANALRASEPEEAARRAREAIRAASTGQARAIIDAACTLASTGRADETVSATSLLAREGPDESTRRWGREFPAIVAAVQGRPGEAARLFEPARDVAPGTPSYLNPRATLLAVGRPGNEAPAAAEELRNGPDVILKAGELALYGDLAGAAKAAQALPAGSPPEVHHRTVRAAVERRWEEAVPALRSALAALKEIDVGKGDARWVWLTEARLLLGQALVEIGEPAEAVEVLRPVDFIGLCSPQAAAQVPGMLVARARAYGKLGRPAEALKDVDRLLGLWKDAEPGLPLHAEAKAMRARLAAAGPTEAAATPSIAVLPFADMSPRHDQEYFADGVAEEILNALSHVEGLKVVGRTSSFSFKGKPDDLKSIGQKLGVANILEGSLRKDGNGIRITAQLIRVADGTHLWSESYDRKLSGVFKVQDEIAKAVVGALKVRLLPAARAAPRSHDPDAYAPYLLGRQILSRMTYEEELPRAIASFEKAVALEPGFAEAWAGLSHALDERAGRQSTLEGVLRDKRKALDAADRAVELAPGPGRVTRRAQPSSTSAAGTGRAASPTRAGRSSSTRATCRPGSSWASCSARWGATRASSNSAAPPSSTR